MRQAGRKRGRAVDGAAFTLDALEPRRLLADAAGIAVIDWQGQQVEMRQGEWIVGLTHPGSSYDEETGELRFNGTSSRSTMPSDSLKAALEAAEKIGVEFQRYLGSEDVFLVKVPDGVTYEQLVEVLDDVPEFHYAEPNGVVRIDSVLPIEWANEPHAVVDVAPVEPPSTGRNVYTAPIQPPHGGDPEVAAFSGSRIGEWDTLDVDPDDDLLA